MIVALRFSAVLALCAGLTAPALSVAQEDLSSQTADPRSVADKSAVASRAMVSAANPLAVEAGLKVLRAGGTAADAAVAVQAVLGLVEPESSGLGGGAFLLFYDARTREVTAYDGRETAPAGATSDMFLDGGKPLGYAAAVTSGRSTGAPGAVAMLKLAHEQHGRRPWSSLFGDAERLAADGFIVGPKLARSIASRAAQATGPDATRYFTKADGSRYVAGDLLKNPAYADTVRRIAAQGPDGLLKGEIGAAIVARVREGAYPGTLTLEDMAGYRPNAAEALCVAWKVNYRVCTPRPPSGGSALLHALLLLEKTDISKRGPGDPVAWAQMAQAERLMYADRDVYVGDPAFASVPTPGWLSQGYVAERAAMIGETIGPWPRAGNPPGAAVFGPDNTQEAAGTTHLSIVDRWGNAVSMTTTVESIFGSGRMVHGFFLNNQLTDFSFSPVQPNGAPAANAVAPGKRPRSAMAPVIVLDNQGRLVAALGSPGGPSIISYNLKALTGLFDWGLSLQQAFDLPNMVARNGSFSSEPALYAPGVVDGMKALGLELRAGSSENSGLHGVLVQGGKLHGAADRRRDGVARGY